MKKYWQIWIAVILTLIIGIGIKKASAVDMWVDVDLEIGTFPVNLLSLTTDGTDVDSDVNYNQAGMALVWNFITTAGIQTQTAVTPADGGAGTDYDWVEAGNGMFTINIPATGGASANNDTEGYGWFTGFATGNLPWRGPVIGFRAATLNNSFVDGTGTLASVAAVFSDPITLSTLGDKVVADMDANSADFNTIIADTVIIGPAVALDGGTQTITGMLTKMADDNGGADFDATSDSLQAIRDRGDSAWSGSGGAGGGRYGKYFGEQYNWYNVAATYTKRNRSNMIVF